MNHVTITGNLTRDVELRFAPRGTAIANFNVAVNEKWRDRDGNLKEEVSFIGCTAFGKLGENMAQYLKKGSKVLIQGRLKQETWEKDGKKQSKTGVTVDRFEFMGGRTDGPTPAPSAKPSTAPESSEPEEDDVPF